MGIRCNISIGYYLKMTQAMADDYDSKLDDILDETCNNAVHMAYDCDGSFPYLISSDKEIGYIYKAKNEDFFGMMDLNSEELLNDNHPKKQEFIQYLHENKVIEILKEHYSDFDDEIHIGLMVLCQ